MIIVPSEYDKHAPLELLRNVELGVVGVDGRLIESLLKRPDGLAAALAEISRRPAEDGVLDLRQQIFDLYRCLRTPEAAAFYVSQLQELEGEIPDELVEAFAELGASAVEPLLALCETAEDVVASDAVFVLAATGVRDARIRGLIRNTLAADPVEGGLCAGLSGDPELIPDLEKRLAELPGDADHDRKALEDALSELRNPASREHEPFDIRALYPEHADPIFDVMPEATVREFLQCVSADLRAGAALSFLDTEYEDETRDLLMAMARGDESAQARGTALRALGERLDDGGVRPLLLEALGDASRGFDERSGALVGLAQDAGTPGVEKYVYEFMRTDEGRATALEAMYRSVDPRFAQHFPEYLRHEDVEVQRQAVRGIGIFGIESSAMHLVPLFRDEALREDALYAYALAMPGKTSAKSVQRMMEQIEDKADGLDPDETQIVAHALDQRLEREGLAPFFYPDEDGHVDQLHSGKVGRNDPCPCGSGKKYKKCCGA